MATIKKIVKSSNVPYIKQRANQDHLLITVDKYHGNKSEISVTGTSIDIDDFEEFIDSLNKE